MYFHVQRLINEIEQDEPDPAAANALQEGLGMSPSNDGTMLDASEQAPEGAPLTISPERFEEFSPGADKELIALIEATAAMEMADIDATFGRL